VAGCAQPRSVAGGRKVAAATLIQCQKIGPFPVILLDGKFWKGLQIWGRDLMKHGFFKRRNPVLAA